MEEVSEILNANESTDIREEVVVLRAYHLCNTIYMFGQEFTPPFIPRNTIGTLEITEERI